MPGFWVHMAPQPIPYPMCLPVAGKVANTNKPINVLGHWSQDFRSAIILVFQFLFPALSPNNTVEVNVNVFHHLITFPFIKKVVWG